MLKYLFFISNLSFGFPSFEEFQNTVTKNWDFSCKAWSITKLDPYIYTHLKDFSEQIIYYGLEKVNEINPIFIDQKLQELKSKKIIFTCTPTPSNFSSGIDAIDEYVLSNFVGFAPAETFAWTGFTPRIFLRGFATNLAKWYDDSKKSYMKVSPFEFDPFDPTDHAYNVIFHEFMHAARFDNLSLSEHNNNDSRYNGKFESDIIYACTAQAYSHYGEYYFIKNKIGYKNTNKACMTCALARFEDKVYVSQKPEDIELAEQACSQIVDEDFAFKEN